MTQFIIHVGPHKTGTTYLQVTLDMLRDQLRERGVYVPSIWNAAPGLPSHMQLAWAIRDNNLAQIREQIKEIVTQQPRYVAISCEALSRLDRGQIGQLRQLLGPAPAQVVYYVRRSPERLPSLWQETIKFGHTIPFPEFLATQLAEYSHSELCDAATIDRFAAIFGATRIRLVSYNHLVESGHDIARHFLACFLEQTNMVIPAAHYPNRSLPTVDTEVIRALNVIHSRYGGKRSPALRNWFLAQTADLISDKVRAIIANSITTIHLEEAAPPFSQALKDLLIRYAAAIVPPRDTVGLHELRAMDVAYVRQDYLLDPAAPKALHGVYEMYRRSA